MRFAADDIIKGKILYASLVEDKNEEWQLEVGVEADAKLIGQKVEDGVENIPTTEVFTRYFLGEKGDPEKAAQRRGICRDHIERLTGVRLADSWESDDGYLRLTPDHPQSVIGDLLGKEVLCKAREYGEKVYWNLYFERQPPKTLSIAEVKKRNKDKTPY